MNVAALLNTLTTGCRTLPVVIFYATEGCNLRCVSCSYRTPPPGELSLPEIRELAASLRRLGLQHIVFSGGEPLMRRDFPEICSFFEGKEIHQTLLTNGLLLEKRLHEVEQYLDEIIVSLDGPSPSVHDAIRGAESFERILRGVEAAVRRGPSVSVAIRTVVQKRNFRTLPAMVRLAKNLGVTRISFLAADVLSESFGRARLGPAAPQEEITLTEAETDELRTVVAEMAEDFADDINRGFISESEARLHDLVLYYQAIRGNAAFPRHPCNAPMVSAVITSTGALQPCFFLPAYGNIREGDLGESLNGDGIRATRRAVRNMKPDRCKTCVCSLYVSPLKALRGHF